MKKGKILLTFFLVISSLLQPTQICQAEENNKFVNLIAKPISLIAVSPNYYSDGCIYVVSGNRFYRSLDSGVTWEQKKLYIDGTFYTDDYYSLYDMICSEDGSLYLSGSRNNYATQDYFLVISNDGGNNWKTVTATGAYNLVSLNSVFWGINAQNGILQKSEQGGILWNWNLFSGLPRKNNIVVVTDNKHIFAVNKKALWSSIDNGTTWNKLRDLASSRCKIYSIQDNNNSVTILCNPDNLVDADIFINDIWEDIDFGSDMKINKNNINCATGLQGGIIILGSSNWSILISKDYGESWSSLTEGLNSTVSALKCVSDGEAVDIFAATPKGLFYLNYPIGDKQSGIKFFVGRRYYNQNNIKKTMEIEPFLYKSKVYVPLRYLAEALQAEIIWDGNKRTVTLSKGNTKLLLTINKNQMLINGEVKNIEVSPVISDNRCFLPAREVAEAFGGSVDWDAKTKIVSVNYIN